MGLLLALHGRYLETHLTAPATGFNHRLGEAAALAVLGSLAPLLPGAPRWRLEGSRVLEESLLRLVLTDGGPAEGSLHYLALVCRLALVADLLSGRGEGPVLSGLPGAAAGGLSLPGRGHRPGPGGERVRRQR